MIASQLEQAALEHLRPELEKDGYEVLAEVSPSILPRNIKGYIPDFVAHKGNEFIAFEVKGSRHLSIHKKLLELKNNFETNDHWQFRIIYTDELRLSSGPKIQTVRSIKASLKEVKRALNGEATHAAFLLCWAAFEAASRLALKEAFARPQSPGRLVTVLAEEGLLTLGESEQLRKLILKRNSLIHGDLSVFIGSNDVGDMIRFVEQVYLFNSREHKPEV